MKKHKSSVCVYNKSVGAIIGRPSEYKIKTTTPALCATSPQGEAFKTPLEGSCRETTEGANNNLTSKKPSFIDGFL